jgi:hypothetical protein
MLVEDAGNERGLEMPTPTKNHTTENLVKDLGLTAAVITAKGWPVELVDSGNGKIFFSFKCNPREFTKLESDYWTGKLSLSARDLLASHRQMKDRLYALKRPR